MAQKAVEKKPFINDTLENDRVSNAWAQQKQKLQKVVDLYNRLPIGPLLNSELGNLFNDPDKFFFDKLTGGKMINVTIGDGDDRIHLPVNKAVAKSILKIPKEYEPIIALIKNTKTDLPIGIGGESHAVLHVYQITSLFKIDNSGKLAYSEKLERIIFNTGKSYLQSKTAQALEAVVAAVEQAYIANGLDKNKFFRGTPQKIFELVTDGGFWDAGTSTFRRAKSFEIFDRDMDGLENCG